MGLRDRAGRCPQGEESDLGRDADADRVPVESDAARDVHLHVAAPEHPLVRQAAETDDGEGAGAGELDADVPAVRMTGKDQIGATLRQGAKRRRVVVEQQPRRPAPRPAGDDPLIARRAIEAIEEEIESGDLQRRTLYLELDQAIAQYLDAGGAQLGDDATDVVVVVVAETSPLPVRGADVRQRLVERSVEIAAAMGEEITGVQHQIGPRAVGELGDAEEALAVHGAADVDIRQVGDAQAVEGARPAGQRDLAFFDAKVVGGLDAAQRDDEGKAHSHRRRSLQELPALRRRERFVAGCGRVPAEKAACGAEQRAQRPRQRRAEEEHGVGAEPHRTHPAEDLAVDERQPPAGAPGEQLRDHHRVENGAHGGKRR